MPLQEGYYEQESNVAGALVSHSGFGRWIAGLLLVKEVKVNVGCGVMDVLSRPVQ